MPVPSIAWLGRPVILNIPKTMTITTSTILSLAPRGTDTSSVELRMPSSIHSAISPPLVTATHAAMSTLTFITADEKRSSYCNTPSEYRTQAGNEMCANNESMYWSMTHTSGGIVLIIFLSVIALNLLACCCVKIKGNKEGFEPNEDDTRPQTAAKRAWMAIIARKRNYALQKKVQKATRRAATERKRQEIAERAEAARRAVERQEAGEADPQSERQPANANTPSLFNRLRRGLFRPDVESLTEQDVEMQDLNRPWARRFGLGQYGGNSGFPARQVPPYVPNVPVRHVGSPPPPMNRPYPRLRSTVPAGGEPAARQPSLSLVSYLELPDPILESRLATPPPVYSAHINDRVVGLNFCQQVPSTAARSRDAEYLPPYQGSIYISRY